MAKTGGTTLNGILATKYERVCGNKGMSISAYKDNEFAAKLEAEGGYELHPWDTPNGKHQIDELERNGFDDCDYISVEVRGADWWTKHFTGGHRHGVEMEIHVPCREPIDHLMSQCNHKHRTFDCNAAKKNDEDLIQAIQACTLALGRFTPDFKKNFKDVKCYDFEKQFTVYTDHMKSILQERKYEPEKYISRHTNEDRDKEHECIWSKPELLEKTRNYLVKNVPYYSFCDACLGSEDDLTRSNPVSSSPEPVLSA
jgi:hypothetical protein